MSNDGTRRVLAKRLANGDVAVALFNQGSVHHDGLHHGGGDRQERQLVHAARRVDQRHLHHHRRRSPRACPAHGTVVYRVSGGGTATRRPPTTFRLRQRGVRPVPGRRPTAPPPTAPSTVIWDCHSGANQQLTQNGQTLQVLGKCLDVPTERRRRHPGADLGLQRRHQPAVDVQRQRHDQQRPLPGAVPGRQRQPPPPTAPPSSCGPATAPPTSAGARS